MKDVWKGNNKLGHSSTRIGQWKFRNIGNYIKYTKNPNARDWHKLLGSSLEWRREATNWWISARI